MNRRTRYLLCIVLTSILACIQTGAVPAAAAGHNYINTIPDPDAFIPSDSPEDPDEDEPEQATAANAKPATAANANQVLNISVPDYTDAVSTETELREWISIYGSTGGTVCLGDTITLTSLLNVRDYDVTIDTASFGLVLNGGSFSGSNLNIIGEGVYVPVVDVIRANPGTLWDSSWNNHLLKLNITAVGRDGVGGTALRILNADSKKFNFTDIAASQLGMIRSYGEGAIGLWLNVPAEAYCYRIEVEGENAAAVYAPNGGDFYYCLLTAEGNGAGVAVGSDIIMDTCSVSPAAQNVKNFNRSFLTGELNYLYLPLKQNSRPGTFDLMRFDVVSLPLSGGSGYDPVRRNFPVVWDNDAYAKIDTGTIGTISIPGSICEQLIDLGLDDIEISLTIDIRPPDIPCISFVKMKQVDSKNVYTLLFWDRYDPVDDNIILWRSDDQGETWWDATWSDDIDWNGSSIEFTYDTLEHPVRFALELAGIGESNIVELNSEGNGFYSNIGGDRTGTDRENPDPPDDKDDNKPGSNEPGEDDNKPGSNEPGEDDNKPGSNEPGEDDSKPGSSNSGGDSSSSSTAPAKEFSSVIKNPAAILPFPGDQTADLIPADIEITESLPDNHPADETLPAGSPDQAVSADAPAVTHETQAPVTYPQTAVVPIDEETSKAPDPVFLPDDPGQTGQVPMTQVTPAIRLMLGIAVLCSGLLLLLRITRK